jgi:geranylgeranyl diphosphate synthase type I
MMWLSVTGAGVEHGATYFEPGDHGGPVLIKVQRYFGGGTQVTNPVVGVAVAPPVPLPSVFHRYHEVINASLRDRLSGDNSFVHSMLRYNMGWSDTDGTPVSATEGKAFRPTLCLLACEVVGGNYQHALPAAVALELIHNFSLIHDEIQDRDETRRHRPTLWAVWGDAKALVAGNVLRVIADSSLEQLLVAEVPFTDIVTINGVITEACLEMIEGQYLDMAYEGRSDIGMKSYLDMIARKTGALIRSPMHVGAIIGTNDKSVIAAFRECGRALGYVFQIRDDVLGIWGDHETTGKPVGADIRRKKNSMPIVHAMSQADGVEKQALEHIYRQEVVNDTDVDVVLNIMDGLGTRDHAHTLAAKHCDYGVESLESIEMSPVARNDIEELAKFLLERQH